MVFNVAVGASVLAIVIAVLVADCTVFVLCKLYKAGSSLLISACMSLFLVLRVMQLSRRIHNRDTDPTAKDWQQVFRDFTGYLV